VSEEAFTELHGTDFSKKIGRRVDQYMTVMRMPCYSVSATIGILYSVPRCIYSALPNFITSFIGQFADIDRSQAPAPSSC
jgi:hypothetical protein